MKNIYKYALILIACSIMGTTFASTHTVDNKAGSSAQFTDLQAAVDAAAVGDTILVAGSSTTYGNIVLNKQLVLIGSGFSGESGSVSTLNYLIIKNENPSLNLNASGSHVEGFLINGNINTSSGVYRYVGLSIEGNDPNAISNVTFTRNRVSSGFHLQYFDQINVYNNIFDGDVGYGPLQNSVFGDYPFGTNLSFKNNICQGGIPRVKGDQVFDHNLFIGGTQTYDLFAGGVGINNSVSGITFTNNILWGYGTGGASASVFSNNLVVITEGNATFSYSDNTAGNNLENVDPQFIDASSDFTFDFTFDFNLDEESPAKTGDSTGGEIGIYGGSYPWPGPLNLKPKGPIVTEIQPVGSPSVPAGSTLEVNFKSVINN